MKKILFFIAMLLCSAGVWGQKTWLGTAGDGLWASPTNWSGGTVPVSTDNVLLDNSTVAGSFTITLPTGATTITINRLTITPTGGNTITVTLPSGNTGNPGFNIGDNTTATDDIILNSGAILINSSGASAGNGIQANTAANGTVRINNGGKYIHNSARSTAGTVPILSTAAGTETGIYEYDSPGTGSAAISASGRNYGTLVLTRTAGAATYSSAGGSALVVRGNFLMNTGVTYTSTMTGAMNVGGNFTNNGAALTLPAAQAVSFNGSGNQTISGSGAITFGEGATISSTSTTILGRNISVPTTKTLLVNGSLDCGTNAVTGAGAFTLDAAGSLKMGSPLGITSAASSGNIQVTGTRTFPSTAIYEYNGGSSQVTGDQLPATVGKLTINNAAGVALTSGVTASTALTLTSGTLSVGANTLTAGGGLTRTAGNIDASNAGASINLDMSSTTLPADIFINEINSLTKNGSSGVSIGSSMTVRTLVLNGGDLVVGVNTLTITTALTKTSGALDATSSNAAVIFTNTAPIVLPAGTFEAGTVDKLTLNGTGGIALSSAMNVSNLTLNSGNIELGANNFIIAGTVSGGSATSYIKTNGIGKITQNNINAEATLPVGNAKYNPVTIENGSGHNWAVSVEDGVVTDPGFPADKAVLVTWNITPSVNPPAGPADISFQFDDATQVGPNFVLANTLQAWYRTSFWNPTGTTAPVIGLAGERKVKITGLTHFSPYALSNPLGPLPIVIDYFNGFKQNSIHLLNWKVNVYNTPTVVLSLERSTDGRNYSEIYSITATALQCQQPFSYTSTQTAPGINYYRLKMTDANGKVSNSGIIALLNKQSGFDIIGVLPNPVTTSGVAVLNITAAQPGTLQIIVTDMSGRKLMTQTETLVAGSVQVPVNFSKLSAGAYQLTGYYSDGTSKTIRLLKQ